jgi:hypothetical protein
MTAQISDKLVNLHPRVEIDGLLLYGVIRGDPREPPTGWGDGAAFAAKPTTEASVTCTALRRGYVATFILQPDGRLKLTSFEYLLSIWEWQKQEIDELVGGDFWLVMKPNFDGDRTYMPFHEGVVVEDRGQWFTEEPPLVRKHRRLQRRREEQADA